MGIKLWTFCLLIKCSTIKIGFWRQALTMQLTYVCGCVCYWRGAQASAVLEGSIPDLHCSGALILPEGSIPDFHCSGALILPEGSIPGLHCSGALICVVVSMCTFPQLSDHQETRVIQPCPCLNIPSLPDQVLPSHYDLQAFPTSSPVLGLASSHPSHIHAHTLLKVSVCSYSASLWASSHSFLFLDSLLPPQHLLFTQYSLPRTPFPYPPQESSPLSPTSCFYFITWIDSMEYNCLVTSIHPSPMIKEAL